MTFEELLLVARASWPAWPGIQPDAFAAFVRALPRSAESSESFEALRAGDLWLAFHAGRGLTPAIAALEATCFADLGHLLRARRADPSHIDEVIQRLRHRLLVAEPGSAPRILGYQGRGDLRAWVRVAAVRVWLNMKRERADGFGRAGGAGQVEGNIEDVLVSEAGSDLELELLKGKYRELFRRCFAESVEALAPGMRLLLKLHYLDKLSMEDIGKVLGVHRLTVLRRLERVRAELSEETKERLETALSLAPSAVDSVLRMIQSHLDVSLERALESRRADEARLG
jgi:RNA polymerase sigma-70 factor (ECF subfamily)